MGASLGPRDGRCDGVALGWSGTDTNDGPELSALVGEEVGESDGLDDGTTTSATT